LGKNPLVTVEDAPTNNLGLLDEIDICGG